MSRASMDLLSSPDPLNESIPSSAAPFTKRVTRSQRSERFASLTDTPRKQTFELDVGNELSPQKIFVTVEAEQSENDNTSRRLFTSPAPRSVIRRRERTTTTTVPLKGMTDDEAGALSDAVTPKRRGRPRRSGTPTPATRKRAGTPIQKTPRRTRKAKSSEEDTTSELSIASSQATPRAGSRARKTPKPKAATPAKKRQTKSTTDSQPKKRGRPRRQALAPEEVEALVDQDAHETTIIVQDPSSEAIQQEEHAQEIWPSPTPEIEDAAASEVAQENEEDIWMEMAAEPTPVASRRREDTYQSDSPVQLPQSELELAPSDVDTFENEEYMEYDDKSDVESQISEAAARSPRRQDTIANGEDFSMISIDPVSSFQANMTMEDADLPEMGEITSLIVSRTLESLRQERILEEEVEPATLDPEVTPRRSLRSKSSEAETSDLPQVRGPLFSEPSPQQAWIRSPRRNKAKPLSRQVALRSLQKDGHNSPSLFTVLPSSSPNRTPKAPSPKRPIDDASMYEDSFSEIPEAVLEAATPRRFQEPRFNLEEEMEELMEDMDAGHEMQSPSRVESIVNSTAPPSESNKLLTPDKTPSPVESHHSQQSKHTSASVMRSSPPVFNLSHGREDDSSSRHSRQSSTETPFVAILSPHLPPAPVAGGDHQVENLTVPLGTPRPTLSPIVRVGRALQNVTSDPPSPKDRESLLGSPFRGSTGRRTQSPVAPQQNETNSPAVEFSAQNASLQPSSAQRTERSWPAAFAPFNQLKNLVVKGAQAFSPRPTSVSAMEDPFVSNASKSDTEIAAIEQRTTSSPSEEANFRASVTSSVQVGPPSDGGMDWEAEVSPPRMTGRGSTANSVSSIIAAKGSVADGDIAQQSETELELPRDVSEAEDDEEEEEEDIWMQLESQRATPVAAHKEPEIVPNPHRRGKLPSPWRKNSQGLFYSDEQSLSSPHAHHDPEGQQTSRAADYSMLSMYSGMSSHVQDNVPQRPGRVDLSAFFSSPAAVPQMLAPGATSLAQTRKQQQNAFKGQAPTTVANAAGPELRQNSFRSGDRLPSISQKLSESNDAMPSIPQKGFRPSSLRSMDIFSLGEPRASAGSEDTQDHPTSPSTPERQVFAHIPQKRNFTPVLGRQGNSLFKPNTTPKMPSFSNRDPQGDDTSQDDSILGQESSFEAPILKPLPGKLASPTKSCLRSPLKPKTPGRVVEFTSSTLDPLLLFQTLADNPGLISWGQDFHTTTIPALVPAHTPEPTDDGDDDGDDKENADSPSKLSLFGTPKAAHLQPKAAAPSPLSQASWSRAHWLRLDGLLQERRKDGPLNFQLRHPAAPTTSTQKRASRSLLGKQVMSQGETLTLEQWHLDVVDAFGAEVGGWEDNVIAKRLFALLVGEERRRLGLVPRRRR